MKRNRFLCLVLALVLALSLCVQGFAITAVAKESHTSLLLGDANLDFKVNVKDATNIQKTVAKISVFGNLANETADVDENKIINVKDATNVQKFSAQYSVPYSVGKNFDFEAEISPNISLKEAADIALEYTELKAEEVVFDDKDFEIKGGTPYFEIEFSANGFEYEVTVNALNGEVANCKKEADDDYREPVKPETPVTPPANEIDLIDEETAKSNALKHAGVSAEDARFEKTELDKDNGRYKYEIEFEANGFEYDYEVDAENGKILDFEKERKDR